MLAGELRLVNCIAAGQRDATWIPRGPSPEDAANFFFTEANKPKHLVEAGEKILCPYQKLFARALDFSGENRGRERPSSQRLQGST